MANSHVKVEYRCQEALGTGFSIQCSNINPWWGACHAVGWPACNLSSDALTHLPTFKAPLESDFLSSLPPPISSQYASVDPALLILGSDQGPVSLTSPTPNCSPPPPPPLEEFLFEGASLTLVNKNLLVACGGSKCFAWNMEQRRHWQLFADTRFSTCRFYRLQLYTVFIHRGRRVGHSAAAMTDGSGRVLLLGGYLNQNTAEIVPG